MIIGIVGKIGVGKSTVSKWLSEELNFKEFSFADSLKEYVEKYFGVSVPYYELHHKEEIRHYFQGLGQFVRDEIDEDFWVNKLHEKLVYFSKDNVVISDVRYMNEAKYVKDNGGFLLKIERDVPTIPHPSETEQNDITCDFLIKNEGTLHDFHYNFSDWIYNLKKEGVIEWERKL